MINQRLCNEHALTIAGKMLAVIRPVLRDEEAGEAFREFFEIAKKELRAFAEAAARMEQRLHPTNRGNG